MSIVFLHGLESTPENSGSAAMVKSLIPNLIVPDYKPLDTYENVKARLMNSLIPYDCEVLVGISIGGFWALKATEFTNVGKVIMLNPALVRGEERYGVSLNTPVDVLGKMLLCMDDDVVNNLQNFNRYHRRFAIDTFETGGHRMVNREEAIVSLRDTFDFLSVWIA